MTLPEYAADRLRRRMGTEHHEAFTGLPWEMLQAYEQRMWLRRAEVVLEAAAAWRHPGEGPSGPTLHA